MTSDSNLPKTIVCFVKTPGFTPLKTRLAKGIGVEKAEEFFTDDLSPPCFDDDEAFMMGGHG